jgi:SulP family sulfate permease
MLIAAPLVAYVPLAALGAVLLVVAWNMAEKSEFLALVRASPADALVLLTTFVLTVFVDLTTGIAVGVVLGAFLFLHRMADAVEVASGIELVTDDQPDLDPARTAYDSGQATDPTVMVYRISGALFFGATAALSTVLDRVGSPPKAFVLDFSNVPLIDITAANSLRGFVNKLQRSGTRICFAGAKPTVRRMLHTAGFLDDAICYTDTAAAALQQLKSGQ